MLLFRRSIQMISWRSILLLIAFCNASIFDEQWMEEGKGTAPTEEGNSGKEEAGKGTMAKSMTKTLFWAEGREEDAGLRGLCRRQVTDGRIHDSGSFVQPSTFPSQSVWLSTISLFRLMIQQRSSTEILRIEKAERLFSD